MAPPAFQPPACVAVSTGPLFAPLGGSGSGLSGFDLLSASRTRRFERRRFEFSSRTPCQILRPAGRARLLVCASAADEGVQTFAAPTPSPPKAAEPAELELLNGSQPVNGSQPAPGAAGSPPAQAAEAASSPPGHHQPFSSTGMTVALAGALAVSAVGLAASQGFSPEGTLRLVTSNHWIQDGLATGFSVVAATTWVRLWELACARGVVGQKLSRKIVHSTSGPLFVLAWNLFSGAPEARFLAALVPAINGLRLLLIGTGVVQNERAVRSVSREGDRRELLRGPLYYCVVMSACTALYWRTSPVGIVALMLMCGGDGFADIVGRRWGAVTGPLPLNGAKSWAGSLAMLGAGFAFSAAFLALFAAAGHIDAGFALGAPGSGLLSGATVAKLAAVAAAATLVEALPSERLDDNWSVPLVALLLSSLLFPR
eukprot:tig00001093_g6895.t1